MSNATIFIVTHESGMDERPDAKRVEGAYSDLGTAIKAQTDTIADLADEYPDDEWSAQVDDTWIDGELTVTAHNNQTGNDDCAFAFIITKHEVA